MNEFKVYLVELNINIEFSDGKFTGWDEKPSAMYSFKNLKDAQKHIWEQKQKEVKKYRKWLQQNVINRECFIHHYYTIRMIDVF